MWAPFPRSNFNPWRQLLLASLRHRSFRHRGLVCIHSKPPKVSDKFKKTLPLYSFVYFSRIFTFYLLVGVAVHNSIAHLFWSTSPKSCRYSICMSFGQLFCPMAYGPLNLMLRSASSNLHCFTSNCSVHTWVWLKILANPVNPKFIQIWLFVTIFP